MSKNNFRRGAAAIRAASLPRDVDEALDRLDVDIIGERGDEIAHTCPECGSEYAKTNREKGVYFCPCGWQGRHWLGSSSNRSATPKRPEYDIEPVWGEGIEPSPSVVSEWDYRDEHGNVVQTIHRREVPIINDDGNKILGTRKKFEVSHDKGLALVWGAPGKHEQVPYRLPELLAADPSEPVWVTEGEKDCDALAALGLVATCEAGYVANSKEAGRTLLWGRVLEEPTLSGRHIKIVADRDRVGIRKALALRDSVQSVSASVEILLPAVGKDVADHLHNGLGLDELEPLPEPARDRVPESRKIDSKPDPDSGIPELVPYLDFRTDIQCTPDEWVLDKGRLLQGEFNILAGIGGMGKTTTYISWVAELSRRGVKVLILAERSFKGLKKRLVAAGTDLENVRTLDPREFVDIHTSIGMIQGAVRDGFSVLVLDPVAHFLPVGAKTHNDGSLRQVCRALSDLMADGQLTTLGIHHLNKNEGADAVNRLMGSAFFRDYPANVLGVGIAPGDEDKRAVVLVKTNADDGVLEGGLIYRGELVDVTVDGHVFRVRKAVFEDVDPEASRENIFARPKESAAEDAAYTLMHSEWVPTYPDGAQDADWFSAKLKEEHGIKLGPKAVTNWLTNLNFGKLEAKPGPHGFKARYWRIEGPGEPPSDEVPESGNPA